MAAKTEDDIAVVEEPEPSIEVQDYVVPVVHVRVPSKLVDVGFWGGLTGAVAVGAVDLPLGVLVGAGVVVARHRMNQ